MHSLLNWIRSLLNWILCLQQGLIDEITITSPNADPIPVVSTIRGKPYNEDSLNGIVQALKGASTENVKHAINNGS